MAVIISYERNDVQKGILCDISLLDKPRIWVDFNETCADDLYFLSQVDIIRDSNGNEIELTENMEISIFDFDLDAGNGKVLTLEQAIKYAEEKAKAKGIKL